MLHHNWWQAHRLFVPVRRGLDVAEGLDDVDHAATVAGKHDRQHVRRDNEEHAKSKIINHGAWHNTCEHAAGSVRLLPPAESVAHLESRRSKSVTLNPDRRLEQIVCQYLPANDGICSA
jgi:hypothetical protein